jgi:hypothetical protein
MNGKENLEDRISLPLLTVQTREKKKDTITDAYRIF